MNCGKWEITFYIHIDDGGKKLLFLTEILFFSCLLLSKNTGKNTISSVQRNEFNEHSHWSIIDRGQWQYLNKSLIVFFLRRIRNKTHKINEFVNEEIKLYDTIKT